MTEKGTPRQVTPRQRKAIECLLTTGDYVQAAREAGVARVTLYRWLKKENFRLTLADAEAEAITSLSRALVGLGEKAAETLKNAMTDTNPLASGARVRAADIVLSRLIALRELVALNDFDERLKAVEEKLP